MGEGEGTGRRRGLFAMENEGWGNADNAHRGGVTTQTSLSEHIATNVEGRYPSGKAQRKRDEASTFNEIEDDGGQRRQ